MTESELKAHFVGDSPAAQRAREFAISAATVDSPVLLTGDTGTGKSWLAPLIHRLSSKGAERFLPVNCSALEPGLAGSRLFGHKRGAFTGASESTNGCFGDVGKGTLFLDEVGELPLPIQAELLTAARERIFYRVGDWHQRDFDGRLIAATNRNINDLVNKGQFRQDLYFRLKYLEFELPTLRERISDLPVLIGALAGKGRLTLPSFDPDAMKVLQGYKWPGNLGELDGVLHKIQIVSFSPKATRVTTDLLQRAAPELFSTAEPTPGTTSLDDDSNSVISVRVPQSTELAEGSLPADRPPQQVDRRAVIEAALRSDLVELIDMALKSGENPFAGLTHATRPPGGVTSLSEMVVEATAAAVRKHARDLAYSNGGRLTPSEVIKKFGLGGRGTRAHLPKRLRAEITKACKAGVEAHRGKKRTD